MKKSFLPAMLAGITFLPYPLLAQQESVSQQDRPLAATGDTAVSTLTGRVYAGDNGQVLPRATVRWSGDNETIVHADTLGAFILPGRVAGGILEVSLVGYQSRLLTVRPGTRQVSIALESLPETGIDEVVVTALGEKRNTRKLGYAVQQLEGAAVQDAREVNYLNALQGKLAGVQVSGNSGAMGGSAGVTVRGLKSISGDNNALFIVDGVPLANMNLNTAMQGTGGGGFDFGNPAQLINPLDIENIAVLKGAAATALYGSRGQNGIVYITTRTGKGAGKLRVNYDFNLQRHRVSLLPDYQNEYGGGSNGAFSRLYFNEHPEGFGPGGGTYDDQDGKGSYDLLPQYSVDESWGPRLDGRQVRPYWSWDPSKGNPDFGKTAAWAAQPDNVKDFFRTGTTLSNNLSVASSGEQGSMRFSAGQLHQDFIYPGSRLDRIFLGLNTSYRLSPRLRFSAGINYVQDESKNRPGTGFFGYNPMLQWVMYGQRQLDIEKLANYQYADGTEQTWNRTAWDNPMPVSAQNPYWNQYESYNTDRNRRYFGNAGFSYRFSEALTAELRVLADFLDHLDEGRVARDYFAGGYTRRMMQYRENNYQLTLNYRKELAGGRLSLEGLAGGNMLDVRSETETGATNGGLMSPGVYVLQNSVLPPSVSNAYARYRTQSLFGSVTMGYRDLLYLTLTGRNDWASPLRQTGHYAFFYPSVSGAFLFSELLPRWHFLDQGKLRLSYARVGNVTSPYAVSPYFDFNAPFNAGNNNYPLQSVPDIRYNDHLKPERTRELEGGLDLRLFGNRINAGLTLYDRRTANQVWTVLLPPETGYGSAIVNGGTVRNRGIELNLSATPVRTSAWSWETGVNLAHNRNKVLDLNSNDGSVQGIETFVLGTERRTQKVSVVAMKGRSLGTIMGTDYVYDAAGNKVVTASGFYAVTPSPVVIGDVNPDLTGGCFNTLTYKSIRLYALIDFQLGGDFFSYTNLYGNKSGMLAATAEGGIRESGVVNEGMTEDGLPNEKVIAAKDHFNSDGGNRISKANLYDASYISLRELNLGWTLPQRWISKAHIQQARLSLTGRNLWLIWSKAPNVDPSSITNSIGNTPGFEGGALPPVRSYGIHLNVTL